MSANLNLIHTVCKKCVFAEYNNDSQTGCFLEMIDRYKKADHINVLEAYDDDKEFFIINGKKCSGYKEESYFDSRGMGDLSLAEKIEYVKNRIKLNYMVVINATSLDINKLNKLLHKISSVDVKPNMVCLLIDENSQYTYNEYRQSLRDSNLNCKWRIQTCLIKEQNYDYLLHNLTNTQKNYNFVLSINSNDENIVEIVNTANDMIYNKFQKFTVLANKNHSVLFYSSLVYRSGFSHGVDILSNEEEFTII